MRPLAAEVHESGAARASSDRVTRLGSAQFATISEQPPDPAFAARAGVPHEHPQLVRAVP